MQQLGELLASHTPTQSASSLLQVGGGGGGGGVDGIVSQHAVLYSLLLAESEREILDRFPLLASPEGQEVEETVVGGLAQLLFAGGTGLSPAPPPGQ